MTNPSIDKSAFKFKPVPSFVSKSFLTSVMCELGLWETEYHSCRGTVWLIPLLCIETFNRKLRSTEAAMMSCIFEPPLRKTTGTCLTFDLHWFLSVNIILEVMNWIVPRICVTSKRNIEYRQVNRYVNTSLFVQLTYHDFIYMHNELWRNLLTMHNTDRSRYSPHSHSHTPIPG